MKNIIKFLIITLTFVCIFIILNMLFQPKYSTTLIEGSMISEYYKEKKDHEVIFIGDCELYANFSPMIMYQEEGIKAFVRGSSQQMIWQSYILLKETLKYEIPKVVVFNVNSLRYDKNSKEVSEAYNRLMIDRMKWSKEKIELIKESMTSEENILSYVFPILRYHSRYDELTNEDFKYLFNKKQNTHNGFLINKNIKPVKTFPTEKKLSTYTFNTESLNYLKLILKLCEDNNIELVLIKAPSLYPHWYKEYDVQVSEFANENNIDYYNLIDEINNIGIDYSTDTYDGGLHLNLNGATKLSKYFAKILKDRYNLNSYIGDKIYEQKLIQYNQDIM